MSRRRWARSTTLLLCLTVVECTGAGERFSAFWPHKSRLFGRDLYASTDSVAEAGRRIATRAKSAAEAFGWRFLDPRRRTSRLPLDPFLDRDQLIATTDVPVVAASPGDLTDVRPISTDVVNTTSFPHDVQRTTQLAHVSAGARVAHHMAADRLDAPPATQPVHVNHRTASYMHCQAPIRHPSNLEFSEPAQREEPARIPLLSTRTKTPPLRNSVHSVTVAYGDYNLVHRFTDLFHPVDAIGHCDRMTDVPGERTERTGELSDDWTVPTADPTKLSGSAAVTSPVPEPTVAIRGRTVFAGAPSPTEENSQRGHCLATGRPNRIENSTASVAGDGPARQRPLGSSSKIIVYSGRFDRLISDNKHGVVITPLSRYRSTTPLDDFVTSTLGLTTDPALNTNSPGVPLANYPIAKPGLLPDLRSGPSEPEPTTASPFEFDTENDANSIDVHESAPDNALTRIVRVKANGGATLAVERSVAVRDTRDPAKPLRLTRAERSSSDPLRDNIVALAFSTVSGPVFDQSDAPLLDDAPVVCMAPENSRSLHNIAWYHEPPPIPDARSGHPSPPWPAWVAIALCSFALLYLLRPALADDTRY